MTRVLLVIVSGAVLAMFMNHALGFYEAGETVLATLAALAAIFSAVVLGVAVTRK